MESMTLSVDFPCFDDSEFDFSYGDSLLIYYLVCF